MNRRLHSSLAPTLARSDSTTSRADRIVLHSNDHWKVRGAIAPIRCLSGTVWITSEGQPDDIVLTAGHEWKPAARGLTLVGALSDAVLCVGAGC